MITRYQVSFEDRLIEPSPSGRWVKYEEHESACADVEERTLTQSKEATADLRTQFQAQSEQVVQLTEANAHLQAELLEDNHNHEHYRRLLKAAKERLALLGHHQNCSSRYTATNGSGTSTVPECNCGLDEWMRESGLNG